MLYDSHNYLSGHEEQPLFTRKDYLKMLFITIIGLVVMIGFSFSAASILLKLFHTIRQDEPVLYFAVVPRAANAVTTAQTVRNLCKKRSIHNEGACHFVVYMGGPARCGNDEQWRREFQKQVLANESVIRTRLYAVQGESAERSTYLYGNDSSSKWIQPAHYYDVVETHVVEPLDVSGTLRIGLMFLDSFALQHGTEEQVQSQIDDLQNRKRAQHIHAPVIISHHRLSYADETRLGKLVRKSYIVISGNNERTEVKKLKDRLYIEGRGDCPLDSDTELVFVEVHRTKIIATAVKDEQETSTAQIFV